jgi:imidazolonepropionase
VRTVDLLLYGASEVVTVDRRGAGPLRGARAMSDLGVVPEGAVAVHQGRVVAVGPTNEIIRSYRGFRRIACRGRTVLPGLVDAHTHPAFAAFRDDEFARRCRGATYEEILAAGGGIHASAARLGETPLPRLARSVRRRLDAMLLHGTTGIEAKSGYGLTTASEIKSLRAIARAGNGHPVEIARTFLGAHALPTAYAGDRAGYVREVVEQMIPRVAKQRLARFCDVFVEKGAFTVGEARRILTAGKRRGLKPKVHADQFRDGGGARLAAEMKAVSAEHLECTRPAGIRALAKAKVIPVLLPGTVLFLDLPRPDARAMIEAGCAVALATDFNPGSSPTENLHLVASLGCTLLGMTPEEVVAAVTRNAAHAAGLQDHQGRIAPGRRANLLILDAPSYVSLAYRMGTNLTWTLISRGTIVVRGGRRVGEWS